MDRAKSIAGVIGLASLLMGCSAKIHPIRVGSKNFTEQIVLGEIIAQHLENRLHKRVERRLNLGGTLLAQEGLRAGDIDLYPEYTGTALAAILKMPATADPAAAFAQVRSAYARNFQIEWLDPLGIDDTFAMVVAGSDARAKHLQTLSDATRETWSLGVGYEFEQRADGLPALEAAYHLRWTAAPKTMDLGLLYKAIAQRQVTMIAANATDGLLSKMDLKVLADDKHAFPSYQACIAVRQDTLRGTPGLREALQELAGKFTNQRMQEMNYEVDGRHRPVAQVASDFLKELEKAQK